MTPPPGKRLAVVTGASAGIGRALALLLAAEGRPVLAVARRSDRLFDLQLEAKARGGAPVEPLALDLTGDGASAVVLARARELGGASLLVNNAGVGLYGRFEASDPRRLSAMVKLNCDVLVALTHAFLPDLQATGAGVVLNVASAGGFQPMPFMAAYGATKAFVVSFTEALAAEGPKGVRLAALCPGPVETEFGEVAGTVGRFRAVPGQVSAQDSARDALALIHGEAVLSVPGPFNKLAVFANRLLPRALVRGAAARILRPRGEAT